MKPTNIIRTLELKTAISTGYVPFSQVLRESCVRCPKSALAETAAQFPDPFNDTVDLLDDAAWRLLIYSGHPHWARLCDATYDPRIELSQAALAGASEVPVEWIGTDPEITAAGIRQVLAEADINVVRAAFLILAFAQSLQLSITEISTVRWWEPDVWKAALQGALLSTS